MRVALSSSGLMLAFAALAASGRVREGDEKFATLLQGVIERNATLRRYFQPQVFKKDLSKNWLPITSECQFSDQCHCGHVGGESADASDNPSPTDCENTKSYGKLFKGRPSISKVSCESMGLPKRPTCRCYTGHGQPCLFGHMSPTKLMLVIATAHASGVTTIIEEGREGGISAAVYSRLGFDVISVEYLPLGMVSKALSELAPEVRQLDGDGGVLIPQIVGNMTDDAAARTLIVFDGEKREQAHATYRKVKGRIAAAVFDDSNKGFRAGTIEPSKDPFVDTEGGQMHDRVGGRTMELSMLEKMDAWAKAPSRVWSHAHNYSKAHFEKSHFIIVQAGRFAAAAATSGTGYRGRDLAR